MGICDLLITRIFVANRIIEQIAIAVVGISLKITYPKNADNTISKYLMGAKADKFENEKEHIRVYCVALLKSPNNARSNMLL